MTRDAKTPKYDEFNAAVNAFGTHAERGFDWSQYLDKSKEIYLELGCGKAEVTLGLGELNSGNNYIGVDLKADRLWRASRYALRDELSNVAFIQANILDLPEYFGRQSVAGIWITFPDPFIKKKSQAKHRMLNPNFLDIYKNLLVPGASIEFKTDNTALFEWAIELLINQEDVVMEEIVFDVYEHEDELSAGVKIQTTFETRFLKEGLRTQYLRFSFSQ